VHNSDGDGGFDVHIGRLCKALNADRAPTSCPGALRWLRLYSAHIGIALGHEDLVDHDDLRRDSTMAVLAGKLSARRPNCAPPAGKNPLNRLKRGQTTPMRYPRRSAATIGGPSRRSGHGTDRLCWPFANIFRCWRQTDSAVVVVGRLGLSHKRPYHRHPADDAS
jgi:hypothetical protein